MKAVKVVGSRYPAVTPSELRRNPQKVLELVEKLKSPVGIRSNGKLRALIVPAEATAEDDWDLTPEEIEELKVRIAEARRDYEEGRCYTMEEARQILGAKWAKQKK